jgi:hypothetical protein
MPTKFTPGHAVMIVLGGLMALLTYLDTDAFCAVTPPMVWCGWTKPGLMVLTVLMGYFGFTTGKAVNGLGGPKGPAIVMLLGLGLVHCQAVAPAANLGQCILADVSKGDSIAQIATDCGADIPSVLIAILESVDPGVLASKAHAEAVAVQAAALREAARK